MGKPRNDTNCIGCGQREPAICLECMRRILDDDEFMRHPPLVRVGQGASRRDYDFPPVVEKGYILVAIACFIVAAVSFGWLIFGG